MASPGSIAVGVLGGIATGLLIASVIVADRIGLPNSAPAGVTEVPAVTSFADPVTVTLRKTAPTVTEVMPPPPAKTTTKTSVVTSTATQTQTQTQTETETETQTTTSTPATTTSAAESPSRSASR